MMPDQSFDVMRAEEFPWRGEHRTSCQLPQLSRDEANGLPLNIGYPAHPNAVQTGRLLVQGCLII